MDEPRLLVALVFILATGALGVYLLLPTAHAPERSHSIRWFGSPLVIISLVLLSSLVGVRVDWWPVQPAGERVSRLLFLLPAVGSLAAAVMTITAREAFRSVLWFVVMLVSNSLLLLLHGAILLAVITLLILACGISVAWLFLAIWAERTGQVQNKKEFLSHEPLLACVTGGLMSVVLIGAILYATGGIGETDPERLGRTMAQKQTTAEFAIDYEQSNIVNLGNILFNNHVTALLIAVVLLLVAFVTVVLIIRRGEEDQNIEHGQKTKG